MRLDILNNGYNWSTKLLFGIIKLFAGYPLPDAARLVFYRPDFYGNLAKQFTQRAMRGSSSWSVGDRELMAAYISHLNQCPFCVKAHSAVAAKADGSHERIEKVIANLQTAPIEAPLRATLEMLAELTQNQAVNVERIRMVLAAGGSPHQIEDALAVGFAFNVTNRLADAFGFFVPTDDAFEAGANYLLKRGYA